MTNFITIKRCDYTTMHCNVCQPTQSQPSPGGSAVLASSGFSCCVPSWRLSALVGATARVS